MHYTQPTSSLTPSPTPITATILHPHYTHTTLILHPHYTNYYTHTTSSLHQLLCTLIHPSLHLGMHHALHLALYSVLYIMHYTEPTPIPTPTSKSTTLPITRYVDIPSPTPTLHCLLHALIPFLTLTPTTITSLTPTTWCYTQHCIRQCIYLTLNQLLY